MPLTNDQKIKIEQNRIKAIQKRENLIELRKKKPLTNVHTDKESFRPITMTSHKIKGDLIKLAIKGDFDVIIHGCNCFCTMGAGIAKSIKTAFPEAYKADLETLKGDKEKLGNFSAANIKRNGQEITIVNAYTQYHYGGPGIKVDYNAIQSVFQKVQRTYSGKRIAYPLIGAGLAGGDWKVISNLINEQLKNENHTLVEFDKS